VRDAQREREDPHRFVECRIAEPLCERFRLCVRVRMSMPLLDDWFGILKSKEDERRTLLPVMEGLDPCELSVVDDEDTGVSRATH
jgi:hypothetical protein